VSHFEGDGRESTKSIFRIQVKQEFKPPRRTFHSILTFKISFSHNRSVSIKVLFVFETPSDEKDTEWPQFFTREISKSLWRIG